MDNKARLHAKIANQAYQKQRLQAINGYIYKPDLSTSKQAVYYNPTKKHTILGIRGTELKDVRDLYDDYNILKHGHSASTPFFDDDEKKYKEIKNKLGGKITLAGHSRGGTSARKIADKHNDAEAYTFNEGFSPKSFLQRFMRRNNKRVKAYRTKKDLISILNPHKTITLPNNPDFKKAHGIENFIT